MVIFTECSQVVAKLVANFPWKRSPPKYQVFARTRERLVSRVAILRLVRKCTLKIKILNIKITGRAKAISIFLYIPITEILTVQRQLGIWDQPMYFRQLVWFLFSINRHTQGSEKVLYCSTKCVQHWSWKLFLYLAEIATDMVFLGQHLLGETK